MTLPSTSWVRPSGPPACGGACWECGLHFVRRLHFSKRFDVAHSMRAPRCPPAGAAGPRLSGCVALDQYGVPPFSANAQTPICRAFLGARLWVRSSPGRRRGKHGQRPGGTPDRLRLLHRWGGGGHPTTTPSALPRLLTHPQGGIPAIPPPSAPVARPLLTAAAGQWRCGSGSAPSFFELRHLLLPTTILRGSGRSTGGGVGGVGAGLLGGGGRLLV